MALLIVLLCYVCLPVGVGCLLLCYLCLVVLYGLWCLVCLGGSGCLLPFGCAGVGLRVELLLV